MILTIWNDSLQIIGPILSPNVWTHITTTYSQLNGYRLYINGSFYTNLTITTNNSLIYSTTKIILGKNDNDSLCKTNENIYNGLIDEFRVYSREFNQSEIDYFFK